MYLKSLPSDYATLEKVFASFRDRGANTVMFKPRIAKGVLDRNALTRVVYLSHLQGLNVFIILPVRELSDAVSAHPDWADLRFDSESGTLQPTGRLDLFNPSVRKFLAVFFKEAASYSVDGILFGEDFYYDDFEGASESAREAYVGKFGAKLAFSEAAERTDSPHVQERCGPIFWNWCEVKKAALMDTLEAIQSAVRTVNKNVKIGIPLHVPGLVTSEEQLAHYAYDLHEFRKKVVDFFWIDVPLRDIREKGNLTYKKSLHVFSLIMQSVSALANDPAKTIITIQTSMPSGDLLPLNEIEEVSMQARKAGEPGLAFAVEPDTQLPAVLTKKIFNHVN